MALASLALGICTTLLILGSIRYGGSRELLLRVRLGLASMLRRPPASLVPTPLPITPVTATARPSPTAMEAADPAVGEGQKGSGMSLTVAISRTSTAPPLMDAWAVDLLSVQPSSSPLSDVTATPVTAADQPVGTTSPEIATSPPYQPAAPSVQLSGITHMWQKWNNCGPATLAMYLSYFDSTLSQAEIAAALKPNWDDKNVSPYEMADFAMQQGLHALVRVNGDAEKLRLLLSNGLPVMVETWLELEPNNGMGHYRLLTGYDDALRIWTAYDSYVSIGVKADAPYQGIQISYEELDALWAVFNRTYLLIFTEEQAPVVASILGEEMDGHVMWERALTRAQTEVANRPDDPFAHFNLGSALVALGEYEQAAAAFDRARIIGLPWRMLWYQFAPFRAYYETGRYAELLALADATIATAGEIEEVYYYKGLGLAALGRQGEARQNWQRALALNPNYGEAAAALATSGDPLLAP
ncbi:MAG: C39 family peptidase [Anaerolineae bacterium]